MTQLLWNVEGGNRHITVMLGDASQFIQRLTSGTGGTEADQDNFEMLYYGMEVAAETETKLTQGPG